MAYVKRKRTRSMRRRRTRRRRASYKKRRRTRKAYYPLYRYRRPDKYTVRLTIDQEFSSGFQLSSIGTPQSTVFQPSVSWCLNFQSYFALFERCRVNCVTFHYQVARAETMIVDATGTGAIASPSMNIPQLMTYLDYNSAQPQTFLSDDDLIEHYSQYSNVKRQLCNRPFTQKYTPVLLQPFYAGLDSSQNIQYGFHTGKKKPWIELNSTQAQKAPMWPALHIGLTSQSATANSQTFLLRPVIYMYLTFSGKRE